MYSILFLVSGNGGTMKFIHKCIKQELLSNYYICGVISNKINGATIYSNAAGIPTRIVNATSAKQDSLLHAMEDMHFDIAITNIHIILNKIIVDKFSGKLINIHPSLLPAFKGLNVVEAAFEKGCKFIGSTVHEVNEEMDDGRILAQSVTPVWEGMMLNQVYNQIFRCWCLNLLNILKQKDPLSERYKANSFFNDNYFNPGITFDLKNFDENFWEEFHNMSMFTPPPPHKTTHTTSL